MEIQIKQLIRFSETHKNKLYVEIVIFIFLITLKTCVIRSITTFSPRESQGKFDLLKSQNVPEEAMRMICCRPRQFMITRASFCLGSSASPDFHVFCLKQN